MSYFHQNPNNLIVQNYKLLSTLLIYLSDLSTDRPNRINPIINMSVGCLLQLSLNYHNNYYTKHQTSKLYQRLGKMSVKLLVDKN